jgi:DNA-binding response OmpR family regulator
MAGGYDGSKHLVILRATSYLTSQGVRMASPLVYLIAQSDAINHKELEREFRQKGFTLEQVSTPGAAWQLMRMRGLPHLVIVDITMPDQDGLELCRNLRDIAALPIIALAPGDADINTRVEILQYVDDLLPRESIKANELAARVERILNRVGSLDYAGKRELALLEGLSFDPVSRQLNAHGTVQKLTPTENALLEVLLRYRGEMVGADTIVARVWGAQLTANTMNALRVHMHRLRHKLEKNPDDPQIISTERGTGYKFAGSK